MRAKRQRAFPLDELAVKVSATTNHFRARFFVGLPVPAVKAVLAAASERRLFANSIIANQEDSADHLFLLTEGRARYFFVTQEGQKIILFWLTPGEIFGGAALLSRPSSYLVSTEMVRDSTVLVWNRMAIRRLINRYPKLMENALSVAFDYFTWYRAAHVALTCHTARQRVAQVLEHLAFGLGQEVAGGIELDVTNEELANAANVTAFTASRLIRQWQRSGALAKSRGKILLRNPKQLFFDQVWKG
jgi:CRP/FNR family transcriptional regulator, nitrogen oxide reductase regulator